MVMVKTMHVYNYGVLHVYPDFMAGIIGIVVCVIKSANTLGNPSLGAV